MHYAGGNQEVGPRRAQAPLAPAAAATAGPAPEIHRVDPESGSTLRLF
jgi:hypothetical protein